MYGTNQMMGQFVSRENAEAAIMNEPQALGLHIIEVWTNPDGERLSLQAGFTWDVHPPKQQVIQVH